MSAKFEVNYGSLIRQAVVDAFKKLNPRDEIKNLVMFVVWLGSIWTTIILFLPGQFNRFNLQICIWLWFTCVFANFAEAMAEGRGKAHADALKKMRTKTMAKKLVDDREVQVASSDLKVGDFFVCVAGDMIAADGEVIDGIATVDESAITGESAPVIRESGGDRSAVTGGTKVTSDRIVVRVTAEEGHSFLDRMIEMIEGARRQKTPNEIALNIVLVSLTALFIIVVFTLPPMAHYNEGQAQQTGVVLTTIPVLLALIVCLIPTTIGGLLSAIGIAGIDRLMRRNVLATSGRAVEAAGDVDVLLLDKTGTITLGNRMSDRFHSRSGGVGGGAGRGGPARQPGGRDPGGPLDRHLGQGQIQSPRPRHHRPGRDLRSVYGPDANERGGLLGQRGRARPQHPQGRRRSVAEICHRPGWQGGTAARVSTMVDEDFRARAPRRWSWPTARGSSA